MSKINRDYRISGFPAGTTRRGQDMFGGISHDMFPEKYEVTDMYESSSMVDDHWRDLLMDTGPEKDSLLAYELPTRNKYSKDRLNLREGARTLTDPWKSEGFDTQFHDKDDRGWSIEQPWDEYKRHVRNQLEMTDFKDDGDYSVTVGPINPNVLYKRIRGTQYDFARRFKNFDTAFGNQRGGGVGVYSNISDVFKTSQDDPYAINANITAEAIPMNQRHTDSLSNIVHSGSKNLHVNTTTDHRVLVAHYGSNLKNRGLATAESQIRQIEDDRRPTIIRDQNTRSISKLMSSRVDGTSAKGAREIQQISENPNDSNRYNKSVSITNTNKSDVITGDIVALMGYTNQEIKYLEREANKNNKQATKSLNDLRDMVEFVHRMPVTERRLFRDQLIVKGLTPGNPDNIRRNAIINPKIMEFMVNSTTSSSKHGDTENMRRESKSLQKMIDTLPVFIYKQKSGSGDYIKIMNETEYDTELSDTMRTVNYKSKIREMESINRKLGTTDNEYFISQETMRGTNKFDSNNRELLLNTELDNKFGENRFLEKGKTVMGSKQTYGYSDMSGLGDSVSQSSRKNPKNL